MCIQVLMDILKPLKRVKKIKRPRRDLKEVSFKYKRLGSYCYLCGLLDHTDEF